MNATLGEWMSTIQQQAHIGVPKKHQFLRKKYCYRKATLIRTTVVFTGNRGHTADGFIWLHIMELSMYRNSLCSVANTDPHSWTLLITHQPPYFFIVAMKQEKLWENENLDFGAAKRRFGSGSLGKPPHNVAHTQERQSAAKRRFGSVLY